MPINATDANTYMESFIGADVPRYDPEDDICIGIYNIFKPLILDFFQVCNNPTTPENRRKLKLIMFQVRTIYYAHGNPLFFERAVAESLIPQPTPGLDPYNSGWMDRWYDMLFTNAGDAPLSVVIQGGEAVNFYTANKYENVPTHDADTRVLAGHHFNYLTKIEDVNIVAKDAMHRYRFFIAFGLMAYLKSMANHVKYEDNFLPYTSRFVPAWNREATLTFVAHWNSLNFYDLIRGGTYGGLGSDLRLIRLLAIGVRVQIPAAAGVPGFNKTCWIVDYMSPFKNPGDPGTAEFNAIRNNIGQSDNLHSYFATDQAISTSDDGVTPPNPAGRIPSMNVPLTIDHANPMLGNLLPPLHTNPIQVRMVPLGFMIFETLRMLFVSNYFEKHHIEHKMEKYKQKLNVLLSTLMRDEISRSVYDTCIQHKSRALLPAAAPPLNPENDPQVAIQSYLLGGRMQEQRVEPYIETSFETPFVSKSTPLDEATLQKALEFSRELIQQDEQRNKKGALKEAIPEPNDMNAAQELGYMDYLSYQNPDFKDFRLPSQIESEDIKVSKELEALLKEAINNAKSREEFEVIDKEGTKTKTGGYRRKTPRNKKGRRMTRRK